MKSLLIAATVALSSFAAGQVLADPWNGCRVSAGVSLSTGSGTAMDKPYAEGPFAGGGVNWGGSMTSFGLSGDTGGGLRAGIGCDRQVEWGGRPFVLGIVADLATGTAGSGASPTSPDVQFSYDVDMIATLRGRAGVVDDRSLYYLTGGLALAKNTTRAFDLAAAPGLGVMDVAGSGSDLGWVVGAGIEWQLNPRQSLTLEFLHHEFEGATATGAATFPSGAFPLFDSTMQQDTLSIGFNWRL